MTATDWQDPDPTAYDPDNPLALLEKAAGKQGMERTQEAIWALQSMLAAGADQSVIEAARGYAAASKILSLGSFDRLVRRHELDAGRDDRDDNRGPSVATELAEIARELYDFGVTTWASRSPSLARGRESWRCSGAARPRCGPSCPVSTSPATARSPPSRP